MGSNVEQNLINLFALCKQDNLLVLKEKINSFPTAIIFDELYVNEKRFSLGFLLDYKEKKTVPILLKNESCIEIFKITDKNSTKEELELFQKKYQEYYSKNIKLKNSRLIRARTYANLFLDLH